MVHEVPGDNQVNTPYSVGCELEVAATVDGGLAGPMPTPTPSLLLVFANLDGDSADTEVQIGAWISGPSALVPGMRGKAQLAFWADIAQIYATPGVAFKLWYDGRIVGFGMVTSYEPEAST